MTYSPDLLRILLIEDNENDAALIMHELKSANGFEILMDVVSTEKDMRAVLERKTVDIVLSDYNLPSFSFRRAIDILDEVGLNVPVILVSGYISDEMKAQMKGTKVYELVTKDQLGKLIHIIRRELLLLRANDEILQVLIRALELKDVETREHSDRVVETTVRIARAMGIGDVEVSHMRRGALLHDVGKIGIPDAILLKKGSLTTEEMEIMRRHPNIGYEILKDIKFLSRALDIPYCHHEKWDGSGYPRALAGTEIPLSARIFTVADFFDAMTNDRPYRKALPVLTATKFIFENRGVFFDPDVVRTFLEIMK